jgi:cytochrome b6-f complex iron-sulfur subunit
MNRRELFKFSWGTVGLAALISAVGISLAAVVRFLMPSVFYEPPQTFKIGTPADFSFGAPTFLVDEKIFVFRDRDKGFAVASAVCTHLGCTVAYFQRDQNFHCPCHGSVFAADGSVEHGPAPRALDWFEVTQARDGQLNVDKDKVVPPTYRLMV